MKQLYRGIKQVRDIGDLTLLCNDVGALYVLVVSGGKDERRYHLVRALDWYSKGGEYDRDGMREEQMKLQAEVYFAERAHHFREEGEWLPLAQMTDDKKLELRKRQDIAAHNYTYISKRLAAPDGYSPTYIPPLVQQLPADPDKDAKHTGTVTTHTHIYHPSHY